MAEEIKDTVIVELKIIEGGEKKVPEQKKEVETLATSILGLQKANKALRDERNKLDLSTDVGIKKAKELNVAIDKNNKTIKENSSSLEKQRLNVGNYTGALDKLIPGLGATVNGIAGMTKAGIAFIATPIGAVIAAVGLALAAVTKYFKGSEEGADKFAKISAQASAVVGVLVDRVTQLGGAIVAFLSGDFKGGLDKLKGSFAGVGDEISREVTLAGQLADIFDQLEEMELKNSVAISGTANEVRRLGILSKNRLDSEQERIKILQQATDLEKKSNGELLAIQQARISATARQIQMDFSQLQSEQKAGETTLEFANRIINNDKILIDKRKELAGLLISYNQTQGESLNLQEKIQNQSDALAEKAAAEADKRNKEAAANADKERQARIEGLEAELEHEHDVYQRRLDFEKAFRQDQLKITDAWVKDTNKKLDAQRKDQSEKDKKNDELKKYLADNEVKYTSQAIGQISQLLNQKTAAYKVLASGQAIIDTYRAATAALAPPPVGAGPIFGPIFAGVAIATGLANVAKINSVKFAKGGVVGGRPHEYGGTKYYGDDGNVVELEKNERFFVLNKNASSEINKLSDLNMKHGGVSWLTNKQPIRRMALGGEVITRNNTNLNITDIQRIVAQTVANIPPPVVYVDDISAKANQVLNSQQRAQVI